jgi:hypothetical protein
MKSAKNSKIILAWLLMSATLMATKAQAEEECLANAWKAINSSEYQNAIKFADQCIDNHKKTADKQEEKLTADKEPIPPTGAVSDAEKNRIFMRGLLNDVGTAYFVKGQAAESLFKKGGKKASTYKEMAEKSYKAACNYKYARTWDPKGWFWSPCESASNHLPL